MASSTQNVKIGVCSLTFTPYEADGITLDVSEVVDLGYTKGGVEVEVQTETHEVMVDQFGNTPISEYIMGRMITVRAPLAETTIDNLKAIMPGTTIVGATNRRADVNTGIGTDLRKIAGQLRVHPIGIANESEDLVIPFTATPGAISFAYKLDEERIFNVEFKGYPANNGKLFHIGYTTTTP